uniref:3-dehydroquinate synthase n=1 Tax=Muribaculaceae bacterium Z82 TaxID=2304548 RepID=A0A7C9NCG2_9BACT
MIVHASIKDYEVRFEDSFENVAAALAEGAPFVVVDRRVHALYPHLFEAVASDRLFLLDAVEEKKVVDSVLDICRAMAAMGAKRNARLVSVGGGITQDVTGFAANILYRGIAWVFVPTTLLAACDSCIGGKTSLNFEGYKNLLGTLYPPDRILIAPSFFETLSEADLASGLGEVVKFNVMGGSDALSELEASIDGLLALDPETVNRFVRRSLEFKRGIIEEDEFDGGRRVLLNFAHTFGHAFEASSSYAIPHGSAVALGMVAADAVSASRGMLSAELRVRIEALVAKIMPPFAPALIDDGAVLSAIMSDKKQTGQGITAVLLDENLELEVVHDMAPAEVALGCAAARRFLEGVRQA